MPVTWWCNVALQHSVLCVWLTWKGLLCKYILCGIFMIQEAWLLGERNLMTDSASPCKTVAKGQEMTLRNSMATLGCHVHVQRFSQIWELNNYQTIFSPICLKRCIQTWRIKKLSTTPMGNPLNLRKSKMATNYLEGLVSLHIEVRFEWFRLWFGDYGTPGAC